MKKSVLIIAFLAAVPAVYTISSAFADSTITDSTADENISSATSSSDYTKPSKVELKQRLTPLQYSVTQSEDTEQQFNNEYWDEKSQGIYVDIVSGEPLF